MRNRFFMGVVLFTLERVSSCCIHTLLSCLSNSAILYFHHNSKYLPPFQIFLCRPATTMDCKHVRVVIGL
ncbi:hypothetical protein ACJW31_11G162900 [Castanea mollissima]